MMNNLPNELLFIIIKNLKNCNLLIFSLLSKRYRNLVNDSLNYEPIKIEENNYKLFLFNKYGLKYKIFYLDLCGIKVTDMSALGNVHTLNLRGTKVNNVSMLENVRYLYLKYTNVTDFSMLKNVNTTE